MCNETKDGKLVDRRDGSKTPVGSRGSLPGKPKNISSCDFK